MFSNLNVFFFVLFASALSLPNAELISSSLEGKIVNGTVVRDEQTFSLVVTVRYNQSHTCGGFLIAGSHVLTAGHCVADNYYENKRNNFGKICNECLLYELNRYVSLYTVYVGSINRQIGGKLHQVIHMELHPNLHPLTQGHPHDIALLTLKQEVTGIPFVDLPEKGQIVKPGTIGVVGGWGIMAAYDKDVEVPQILRSLTLKVMPAEYCKSHIPQFDENTLFCTKKIENKYLYMGDCGSPFLFNGLAWGINAFGNAKKPAIFAMVPAAIDFINEAKCRGEEKRKALCRLEKPSLGHVVNSADKVSPNYEVWSDDEDSSDDESGSDNEVSSHKEVHPLTKGNEHSESEPRPLMDIIPRLEKTMLVELCGVENSAQSTKLAQLKNVDQITKLARVTK